MKDKITVFWFRRDLRLSDNKGLSAALQSGFPVLPIFIFDPNILEKLTDKYDRRVDYIHQALQALQEDLVAEGGDIRVFHADPLDVFKQLDKTYEIASVYCNRDYEPEAIKRDKGVEQWLKSNDISLVTAKDQVIFERDDILKADGTPYTVYTPYSRKWKEKLEDKLHRAAIMKTQHLLPLEQQQLPSLNALGFEKTDMRYEEPKLEARIIDDYGEHRDFPAKDHTTRLGIALRFGTISVRACVQFALKHNNTWLSELIWREFFMQILAHFPQVVTKSFKPQYDLIEWRNDEDDFQRWCVGETGYPLVDAGMRQLNETGFMHNRVRMVVASFLTKHLLIDWRWGEAYFAEKLLDYELSSNNGNWQWAAGCGCDAAPYFRIFNPSEQTKKFDKDLAYIKAWNPDFESLTNNPVVKHEFARERALKVYKRALDKNREG